MEGDEHRQKGRANAMLYQMKIVFTENWIWTDAYRHYGIHGEQT